MGKGDMPRPIEVDWEIFERNWNEVFGIKEKNYVDLQHTNENLKQEKEKENNGS